MTIQLETTETVDRRTLRKVFTAGLIGTAIEYYDFFIFGAAAALVFPTIFFAGASDTLALFSSFATFGVAFVARPVGGVVFGHIGDRIGRKATLVATLLVMGSATVLIGVLPSHATIGVAAPILLVIVRFAQGLAVGGEWASVAIFVGEYSPPRKRAVFTLAPSLGTAAGLLLATLAFLVIGWSMTDETFLAWGWRVPFLVSIVLIVVGLIVRSKIEETPVFKAALEDRPAPEGAPLILLVRHHWRCVLLGAGTVLLGLSFFYMATVYMTSYGTAQLGHTRNQMLTASSIAVLFYAGGAVVGAVMADKVGRKRVLTTAALLALLLAVVLFPVAGLGLFAMGAVISATLFVCGLATAVTTPLLPELFPTEYRSTGMGVAFNLSAIVGGGVVPLVSVPILAEWGGTTTLAAMMAAIALVALFSITRLAETRGSSLSTVGQATPDVAPAHD